MVASWCLLFDCYWCVVCLLRVCCCVACCLLLKVWPSLFVGRCVLPDVSMCVVCGLLCVVCRLVVGG